MGTTAVGGVDCFFFKKLLNAHTYPVGPRHVCTVPPSVPVAQATWRLKNMLLLCVFDCGVLKSETALRRNVL